MKFIIRTLLFPLWFVFHVKTNPKWLCRVPFVGHDDHAYADDAYGEDTLDALRDYGCYWAKCRRCCRTVSDSCR